MKRTHFFTSAILLTSLLQFGCASPGRPNAKKITLYPPFETVPVQSAKVGEDYIFDQTNSRLVTAKVYTQKELELDDRESGYVQKLTPKKSTNVIFVRWTELEKVGRKVETYTVMIEAPRDAFDGSTYNLGETVKKASFQFQSEAYFSNSWKCGGTVHLPALAESGAEVSFYGNVDIYCNDFVDSRSQRQDLVRHLKLTKSNQVE
jgi:hypothetical protein